MHKVPNLKTSMQIEEFSVEIGEVNGVKLYETKKHMKKNSKK